MTFRALENGASEAIPQQANVLNQALAEYSDDSDIDDFVRATAAAAHRGEDKAIEWAAKLKEQDIITVGDLRELLDEDWSSIGLTVFALRALKNMLYQSKRGGGTTDSGEATA